MDNDKLGFVDLNTEQSEDGIRYTPIKFENAHIK